MEEYYSNRGKNQLQLPKIHQNYSQLKKNKLKQFFRTDRSISDTKQQFENCEKKHQQDYDNDYSLQTERIGRDLSQQQSVLFKKDKLMDFLKEKMISQRSSCLQKWDNTTLPSLSNLNNVQNKSVSSNSSHKLFDESESEFGISSVNSSSISDESDNSQKKRFKDFEKDIEKIQRKMSSELSKSFFGYIKNQDKIKDLIQNFRRRDSDNPLYFYCINEELFPKRIDLTNCLIEQKEMNFRDLRVNSKYFPLLSQLLKSKKCRKVKSLYLSCNHLREHSLSIFIDSFPSSLKDLNISQNELGKQGAVLIAGLFRKHKHLKYLNIANNFLGDSGAITIMNAVSEAKTVKNLNLSQNQITDKISEYFFTFLMVNQAIEILTLNWNQLGPQTGLKIAQAIRNNKNLKVLDLSYNHLGFNEKSNCIEQWCLVIQDPQFALCHLDVSYNQLNEKQLRQLQSALTKNYTLYGIHVEGNKCPAYIDYNGFLQFSKQDGIVKQIQQSKVSIDGVNYIPITNGQQLTHDCCWICQGWMEQQFLYKPESQVDQVPIFLHLSFLDYKPIPLTSSQEMKSMLLEQNKSNRELELTTGEIIHQLKQITDGEKKITMAAIQEAYHTETNTKNEDKNQIIEEFDKFYYTTYQMCPPKTKILYFYSDPLRERYFHDPNQEYIQTPNDDLILQGKDPKHQYHVFQDNTSIPFRKINNVNVIYTKQEYVIDDKNNYKPLIKVQPREQQKKYILKKFIGKLKNKNKNMSIWVREESNTFRQIIGDSEDLLDQAFEFDWNSSKIQRFVKSEYERMKLKEYFREKFPLLKDIYKLYSSFGYQPPIYDMFCIQFNQFSKIISTFVDGENLKFSDIDSALVSVKNNVDTKFIYNPDRAIIRYQFIEMLFRLANDKYIRSGQCKNYADAIYRLLREIDNNFEALDNSQAWRQERFWTKEIDLIISFKMPFLKKLYELATDLNSKKWYFKLKWISVKEFQDFCKLYANDLLSEKQITIIFNYSMQTQVDELTSDRFLRMSFNEFLEALGRISEKISPAPLGEDADTWPTLARQTLPLHIKFESFLTSIFLKLRKQTEFVQFGELFCKDVLDGYERLLFMPKNQVREVQEEFVNSSQQLTVYNSIAFLNSHKQPYIHPNYKNFLKLTTTGFNKRPQILNLQFTRQLSGRTTIFEQSQPKRNNQINAIYETEEI